MARIIPWNLPPVNGGSVGGYTPAPTPPVPTNYPYDLDDMVLSTSFKNNDYGPYESNGSYYYFNWFTGKLSVSGVKILDAVNVASVIATVSVGSGTLTYTQAGVEKTYTINEDTALVDITNIMSSVGGDAEIYTGTTTDGKGNTRHYITDAKRESLYGTVYVSSTATLTVTAITVYNSNGVAIQEWSP